MATYVEIPEAATDPDAPLTSALAKAWSNNVLAIAEGDGSAPNVMARALSGVSLPFVQGDGTNANGYIGIDGVRLLRLEIGLGSATSQLRVRFTTDNGDTWSGWSNIASGLVAEAVNVIRYIDLESKAYRTEYSDWSPISSVPDGVNGVQFSRSGAGTYSVNSMVLEGMTT